MKPENVNPNNFAVDKILYDDGDFSIAFGTWEDGTKSIGMRWNGVSDADAGYPKVFGNPMWFLIPDNLATEFMKSLLGNQYATSSVIIDKLSLFYNK